MERFLESPQPSWVRDEFSLGPKAELLSVFSELLFQITSLPVPKGFQIYRELQDGAGF